ncbi:MAG TPA: hypothetical protein VGE12_13425 [Noviherbaspirillum sp.]
MHNKSLKYLHLLPDAPLPDLAGLQRFKAVLAVESPVSQTWQWDLCRWLVASGCLCLLAWGTECEAWREAVEEANLERFDYGEIPEEDLVVTTAHEDEELDDVFWFAKSRARHPVLELNDVLFIHVGDQEKRAEFEARYAQA